MYMVVEEYFGHTVKSVVLKVTIITIKTASFTPPSVIKLHLLFAHAFTCFGFLVNHLQKETTID
jgi:hypothetical protein